LGSARQMGANTGALRTVSVRNTADSVRAIGAIKLVAQDAAISTAAAEAWFVRYA
jgi:hypothetical protein